MSVPPLSERARPVLEYMLHLALHGGGYEWLGLCGWARADEIRAAVPRWGALERVAHRRPWLDREDVRDPGRIQPVWIFRITEEGTRALAGAGADVPSLPTPVPARAERPATRFFLPLSSADALIVLQAERQRPTAGAYLPGETGWLSVAVISERARSFGLGRGVFSDDVRRLVKLGLTEEQRIPPQGHVRVIYRVTEAGAETEPLRWKEPRDPDAPPPEAPRLALPVPPGEGGR